MLSRQPGSNDPPEGRREATEAQDATNHVDYDALLATNELLYEQVASLQAELNAKDEQLRSLEQELQATNQEIDLINQELQGQFQQASLSLPQALQIARQLLLTPLPYRDAILQLLNEIYATSIDFEQLDLERHLPQITPQLRLALAMAWSAHDRRRLRHQFIELGIRFIGSKSTHTKLKQQFRELTAQYSSDADLTEFAEAIEASTAEISEP